MKIPHIFHIVRYWCICKKSFSVVMKLNTWISGAPSPTNFHPQQIVKQY